MSHILTGMTLHIFYYLELCFIVCWRSSSWGWWKSFSYYIWVLKRSFAFCMPWLSFHLSSLLLPSVAYIPVYLTESLSESLSIFHIMFTHTFVTTIYNLEPSDLDH